jgi:TatA/E family protein of Tat protein translocase
VFGLILESLSSTELLFILVIALIFFGPRKLPQLARSMGKGLAEFRKASDDFKRTWEREVAIEASKFDFEAENTILPTEQAQPLLGENVEPEPLVESADSELVVARGSTPEPLSQSVEPLTAASESTTPEPLRKQDWL